MRLVLERFTHNAVAMLAVTTILFFMFRLMPGTPLAAFISENLNADQQQAMLEQFGLDRPMWQQYFIYLGNLLQGEMGLSFFQRRSVTTILLEVMHEEFVTMARMKGFSEWRIVIHHAARNALLPVATAFALGVGLSMGGNVVIETVFSWPGIGRLLVQAVSVHDYPLAQGAFLMIALVLALMNFVADLLYMVLDPRVSHGRKS